MRFMAPAVAALLVANAPAMAVDPPGKKAFERHCVHCHGPAIDAPATLQLGRTRGEDKALLTERKDLGKEYVQYVVRHGLKSMPAFVPSDLTDADLRALADYLAR